MTPLGGALLGMVIVAIDIRLGTLDVLADPIGWVLIAVSPGKLASRNPWFGRAAIAAWVGAVVAIPSVFADPQNVLPLWVADVVLETAVLFSLCTAMIALLEVAHPARGPLNAIRWVDLASTVIVVGLGLAVPQVGAVALVVVLIALAVAIAFAVLLFQLRHHPAFTVGSGAPAGPALS